MPSISMPWSKEQVINLIQSSEALKGAAEEQQFWLNRAEYMGPEDLAKLAAVLVKEAESRKIVQTSLLEKSIQNNQAYIEELHKVKPKMLKEWEAASRTEEKPDSILDQINNV
ncbi:hypothetical protein IPG41_04100 [Candidatus Peregrinibacteria bacterium]|nr:MAG: hypothetical protein IPG41_04100 [Candidatus Peregrinibacteria bacterium]